MRRNNIKRMDVIQNMDSIVCRYFASPSGCKFGRNCYFPHIVDRRRKPDNICRFFLSNKCMFGDRCWHVHKNIPFQHKEDVSEFSAEINNRTNLHFNSTQDKVERNHNGEFLVYNSYPTFYSEHWDGAFNNYIYSNTVVNNMPFGGQNETFSLYPHISGLNFGSFNYYYEILPTYFHEYALQPYLESNLLHQSGLYSNSINETAAEGQVKQDASDFSDVSSNISTIGCYDSEDIFTTFPQVIENQSASQDHGEINSQSLSEVNLNENDKNAIRCTKNDETLYLFDTNFSSEVSHFDYFQNASSIWGNSINKEYEKIPEVEFVQLNGNEIEVECENNFHEVSFSNPFQSMSATSSSNINKEYEKISEEGYKKVNGNESNLFEVDHSNHFPYANDSWNSYANEEIEEILELVPVQYNTNEKQNYSNLSEVSHSSNSQYTNENWDISINEIDERISDENLMEKNKNENDLLEKSFTHSNQNVFQNNCTNTIDFSNVLVEMGSSDFETPITNSNSKNNYQKSKRLKSFQSTTTFQRHSNYKKVEKQDKKYAPKNKCKQSKMHQNFDVNDNTQYFSIGFHQNNRFKRKGVMRKCKNLQMFTEIKETGRELSERNHLPKKRPRFNSLGEIERTGLQSQNGSAPGFVNKNSFNKKSSITCSICDQNIRHTYAILDACDHTFCLKCIYWWRSLQNDSADFENYSAPCPVCDKVSTCVIPTRRWIKNVKEKENIVKKYKSLLKQKIHCKHFKRGRGFCIYGNFCIYLHESK